jgi:hypothetical protein
MHLTDAYLHGAVEAHTPVESKLYGYFKEIERGGISF